MVIAKDPVGHEPLAWLTGDIADQPLIALSSPFAVLVGELPMPPGKRWRGSGREYREDCKTANESGHKSPTAAEN